MKRLDARLSALEAITGAGEGCPHRVYDACKAAQLTAPEPLRGERLPDWLERVPSDTLKRFIEVYRDAPTTPR